MNFLTPTPMVVVLALGVPVLVALYLLKLRRRPVRVSSIMLWAEAKHDLEANVPLRWLKPSVLLFVQLVVLALLALALGQPVFGERGAADERVVVILDASASMRATDMPDGRSRFQHALEDAEAIVRRSLDRDGWAAVIVCRAEPALVGPPTRSAREAVRQVRSITPTDEPGELRAAMELAETVLLSAGGTDGLSEANTQPERASVVLVSDGGDGVGVPLSLAGAAFDFRRQAPREDTRDNLGITTIGTRRDIDDPLTATVLVGVRSTRAEATSAVLTLETPIGVQQAALRVPPADEGAATHAFRVRTPGAFLANVRLERDDVLAADNRAAVIVPAARRPAVLLVAPAAADNPTGEPDPDPFLAAVLTELDLAALRVVSAERYATLPAGLGYDLVVFDRVTPAIDPQGPSLHIGAQPAGVPELERLRGRTRALAWERLHPALAGLSLDGLVVGERLRLPDRPPEGYSKLEVLVDGRDTPLIIELTQASIRRLVVGYELAQSNWPVQVSFAVFVASGVDYLAPSGSVGAGLAFRTGQPAYAAAGETTAFIIETPDGSTYDAQAPGATPRVTIPRTPLAGVYRVVGAPVPGGLAPVNLADEGETSLAAPDTLRVAGREAQGSGARTGAAPAAWRGWLAAAALALLAIEWLWFASATRLRRG